LSGIESSFGVVKKNRREEIRDKILMPDFSGKYLPRHIQNWSAEKIEQFKRDVESIGYTKYDAGDYFKSQYGLSQKEYCHVVNVILGISTTVFPRTNKPHKKQTSIEAFVQNVLDKYQVLYRAEKYICGGHWRIDFMFERRKAVEVYGTYHHADPRVFREIDLDAVQRFNVKRDKERNDWLTNNNYTLLVIWQKDIQERPSWVVAELLKYTGVSYDRTTEEFDGGLFQASLWD
jgi:very-short-patch-repair endonuclease